jgi:hypothetical protein
MCDIFITHFFMNVGVLCVIKYHTFFMNVGVLCVIKISHIFYECWCSMCDKNITHFKGKGGLAPFRVWCFGWF